MESEMSQSQHVIVQSQLHFSIRNSLGRGSGLLKSFQSFAADQTPGENVVPIASLGSSNVTRHLIVGANCSTLRRLWARRNVQMKSDMGICLTG